MALSGSGTRFVGVQGWDVQGGGFIFFLRAQPTGSYPANGELVSDLVALAVFGGKIKIAAAVRPELITVDSNLGHNWTYDPAIGTMGSLRNWTAISNTPTEHATGAYDGNEASAILNIAIFTGKFRTVSG